MADRAFMSLTHSIFAGRAERRLGPPRPVPFTPPSVEPPHPPPAPIAPDAELLAILLATPACADTIECAFRDKERALRQLFVTMSIGVSRALHARLATPRDGDEIAEIFHRFVPERRARLLAFLADAPRRAAITASKGARRG
jgi:hypothetical protein